MRAEQFVSSRVWRSELYDFDNSGDSRSKWIKGNEVNAYHENSFSIVFAYDKTAFNSGNMY